MWKITLPGRIIIIKNACRYYTRGSLPPKPATHRWLGVRLEGLGAFATFCAAVVAVENRAGASSAGLVLSYAMQVRHEPGTETEIW